MNKLAELRFIAEYPSITENEAQAPWTLIDKTIAETALQDVEFILGNCQRFILWQKKEFSRTNK